MLSTKKFGLQICKSPIRKLQKRYAPQIANPQNATFAEGSQFLSAEVSIFSRISAFSFISSHYPMVKKCVTSWERKLNYIFYNKSERETACSA
jgi:hypothetical protein